MEWTWNADEFDGIQINTPNGEFEIVGRDGNQVVMEGESQPRRLRSAPHIDGRWLVFQPFPGEGDWTIELPKSKAWVLQVALASGEIHVADVHARFDLQLGSGELQMENCRGIFNVQSGSGDVQMEKCTQADVPIAPDHAPEADAGTVPPPPGIPPIPPVPPIGVRMKGRRINVDVPMDWEEYGRDWEEWGEQFGEQVSRWAEKFSREFMRDFDFGGKKAETGPGIHIRLGSGDIHMELIDAQLLTARLGNGDVQIEDGRIGTLDAQTSRGEISIENILPTESWDLTTRHGDIALVLPADSFVRLDAATRHGEIICDAPLVRVNRPGPGARHGGRMVGTVGEGQGEPVDIHLESQHGDIQIEVSSRTSRYAGEPKPAAKRPAPTPTPTPSSSMQPAPPTPPPAPATASSVVPVQVTDLPPTEPDAALKPPSPKGMQVYDSQLAILQALQRGEITVPEAEMLLKSLKT